MRRGVPAKDSEMTITSYPGLLHHIYKYTSHFWIHNHDDTITYPSLYMVLLTTVRTYIVV